MLTTYPEVPKNLQQYIIANVLPQYDNFDAAHQRDHAETVISESMQLARHYEINMSMVYAIAACHDLGLREGRKHHHEVSAKIIRQDTRLKQWFTENEIEIMAEAAEDHRASSHHAPRTIYGRIVAEADRLIDTEMVLRRTVQYGLSHYPELNKDEHFKRMCEHLQEKYAEGGYLKLWIQESPNAKHLEDLRKVIAQPILLREYFDKLYYEETYKH